MITNARSERVMIAAGHWLKHIRKYNCMTQRAMAATLSCNLNSYGSWELGRAMIPIQVFMFLCERYMLSPIEEMARIFCEAKI